MGKKKPKTALEARGVLAEIPDDMFTRQDAAKLIERSYDTVRRWHYDGTYKSTHYIQSGRSKVHLYTRADIREMKELAATIKSGPNKKEGE